MSDCIFCAITAGDIPSKKLFEDENVVCFHDIEPAAPTHVIVIPKVHVASLAALDDAGLAGTCLMACRRAADMLGLGEGYRVVTNVGPNGGQTVHHLHFHVMGGHRLGTMG